MPIDLVYIALGERFGRFPWEVKEAPADELAYFMAVMGEEARVKSELDGLDFDDVMFWGDDE